MIYSAYLKYWSSLLSFSSPSFRLYLLQRGRTALSVAQQGSHVDITALLQAHQTHAETSVWDPLPCPRGWTQRHRCRSTRNVQVQMVPCSLLCIEPFFLLYIEPFFIPQLRSIISFLCLLSLFLSSFSSPSVSFSPSLCWSPIGSVLTELSWSR